jgi:hypothetical protein
MFKVLSKNIIFNTVWIILKHVQLKVETRMNVIIIETLTEIIKMVNWNLYTIYASQSKLVLLYLLMYYSLFQ